MMETLRFVDRSLDETHSAAACGTEILHVAGLSDRRAFDVGEDRMGVVHPAVDHAAVDEPVAVHQLWGAVHLRDPLGGGY